MREYDFERKLAIEAGGLLRTFIGRRKEPIWKGPTDFKTAADDAVGELVRGRIGARFPEHAIWSEELPPKKGDESCWYADELDGTLQFARGYSDRWSFSLGFQSKSQQFGFVNQAGREMLFEAIAGARAFCNLQEIHVTECSKINHAVVGWDAGKVSNRADVIPYVAKLFAADGVNYAPSGACASAGLISVACGELDAFFALHVQPEDVVAAVPIVRGAGGLVTAFNGSEWHPHCGSIFASNPVLHGKLLAFFRAGLL